MPWDRCQTLKSIRTSLIEEVYELIEAINERNNKKIEEELGDLVFLALFALRIACDEGVTGQKKFYERLLKKYRERHPHVFGQRKVSSREDVLKVWQEWKNDIFDGIPKSLPALIQARLVQERAARHKFDWPDLQGPLAKIDEEFKEVKKALSTRRIKQVADEIGDLLFSVVNLSRFLKIDAEHALGQTNRKFVGRFRRVIKELKTRGRKSGEATLEEMDRIWEKHKRK